jgi:YHS domain-containing protein
MPNVLTYLARIVVLSAGLMLSGLAAAQNAPHVALKGYDPVAYFTDKRPVKGANEHSFDFDGSRYLFSSDKNQATFAADPDRYAPQFSALCTTGLAAGKKVEADPNQWAIVDGKLYLFASAGAVVKAKSDPTIVSAAQANWSRLK